MFAHDTLIQSEIEMQVIANLQNTVPGDPPRARAVLLYSSGAVKRRDNYHDPPSSKVFHLL